MPDRSVLSIIGAADDSSTICSESAIALCSEKHHHGIYVFSSMGHDSLLLFPKEEDSKSFHQRRELVRDVLQHFRALPQSLQELLIRVYNLLRHRHFHDSLQQASRFGNVATQMWSSEKEYGVCRDVDVVQMFYKLRGSAGRIRECLQQMSTLFSIASDLP